MSRDEVMASLAGYREGDLNWRSGKTFAYVYDPGREAEKIGKEAFASFLSENALDPTAFPSLLRLENELIALALDHLRAPEGSVGTFTSGGTESIMLAVKSAREHARAHRPEVSQPEMILPVTAHAAFHKAASYLGIKVVMVDVDGASLKAVPEAMEAAITDQTILMVGSSPSYAHGVVDPIEELGAIAQRAGLLFHVDACVGGWLLPFFRELGVEVGGFDFQVPGVTSISMDLHKYAFTPKGSSVVLYRDAALRHHQFFACANWTGYAVINAAVQSSKSGGPLAASWAVLHSLGRQGYLDIARRLNEAMIQIREGLVGLEGVEIMGDPRFCMVAFTCEGFNAFLLADEMKRRGWYVQAQHCYGDHRENIHLSVHPGNLSWVSDFLADLAQAVEVVKQKPALELPEGLAQSLASMDPSLLGPEQLVGLLSMAGVSGSELPEEMAEINALLNLLPPRFKEAVLKAFFGHLFTPAGED
jgi:glutamate/tyrosine decarboxylase-like PLP-dependent enzyme